MQGILIALSNCLPYTLIQPQVLEWLQVFWREVVVGANLVVDKNLFHVFLYTQAGSIIMYFLGER